ncbi:nitrogen permease regulator of amino acid transport activity 3-domain-containing protein [Mycena floridula]|nr:nitrogen permease regulator of amino acid transport activity 3-domain-containing protein [Mycena floridula]
MAETLLAILLVTSSAKGSSLVYRWPAGEARSHRYSRPLPEDLDSVSHLDNPWRASHSGETPSANRSIPEGDPSYKWKKPTLSPSAASGSGRSSPTKMGSFEMADSHIVDEYEQLFGYSAEFLAGILCPQPSMCHQKFELLVDDLAFLGHPVCAEVDGVWQFRPEKLKASSRGRETGNRQSPAENSASPDRNSSMEKSGQSKSSWLHTLNFVLVLDLPDPSSSASGNISKYFDVIYQQIAFPVTAVLFQEQVVSNFVELECDTLGALKDSCVTKGESYAKYMNDALEMSSIAPAMKALYLAIKSQTMAYISIHSLPLELQLPPHLDMLLRSDEDEMDLWNDPVEEDSLIWGPELSFGRKETLAPWKSLLLLDSHDGFDPYMNLRGPYISSEDRTLVEGLIRFLESASVTLSLADMATLLDWDLDSQVFPAVRWLVLHRRAKIVDLVHGGLKTVFTLAPKFDQKLSQLAVDFEKDFSHPSIPSLPEILATISQSTSKQGDNHFFASVVRSKELIPLYHDVVLWMLKRDMLITLHLRIRVIATQELKSRVRRIRENARRRREQNYEAETDSQTTGRIAWLSLSPQSARRHSRRGPSTDSVHSELSELNFQEDEDDEDRPDEEEPSHSDNDDDDSGQDATEDNSMPSMINDPGSATPLQRRWLSAMSDGKDPYVALRFKLINQYFDGKKTDDEILFRADITRKQLREVLHHYEEYLQTFLHPS